MADVAASPKEGAPPAIITGSPVANTAPTAVDEANGAVTTESSARRGRKTFSPGGHYADPLSPIASTPLKRQRAYTAEKVGKSSAKPTAGGGSSVKKQKLHEDVSTPIGGVGTNGSAPNGSASDVFFSPRKLVNEYDAEMEMKTDEQMSKESSATVSPRAASTSTKHSEHGDSEAASGDDGPNSELFSPMLKPPSRSTTRTSSDPSPSSSHSKIDASFLSSSSTCSERNDDEEEMTIVTTTTTTTVTVENEELEEDDDEVTYGVGSESGSEASLAEQEFNPFYFMKTLPKYDEIVSCPRPIALPAKSRNAPKISLVLDLDETLVHCSVDDVANPHLQFPVNFNGVEYTVKVKKRPHMEYFLKRVSQLFEVVVFTASHRAYAETLLNLLDPHRNLIKYRLYRDDCLDVYGNYLKDLNVLGRNLATVLLVDNSPHAFGYQVNNGVPIETWYDDEGDDELLNLLPFLESLVDVDDVRPIVEKQFQIQKLIDATPDEVI